MLVSLLNLAPMIPIVKHHHERYDGNGYPGRACAARQIPLLARIVAVADAFDAMTSDRPYRRGLPSSKRFEEIAQTAGTQFDPVFAAAFLEVRDDLHARCNRRRPPCRPRAIVGGVGVIRQCRSYNDENEDKRFFILHSAF